MCVLLAPDFLKESPTHEEDDDVLINEGLRPKAEERAQQVVGGRLRKPSDKLPFVPRLSYTSLPPRAFSIPSKKVLFIKKLFF